MKKRGLFFIPVFLGILLVFIFSRLGALDYGPSLNFNIQLESLEDENKKLKETLAFANQDLLSLNNYINELDNRYDKLYYKYDSIRKKINNFEKKLLQCQNDYNERTLDPRSNLSRSTQEPVPFSDLKSQRFSEPWNDARYFDSFKGKQENCNLPISFDSFSQATFSLDTFQPLREKAWGIQLLASSSVCNVYESYKDYKVSFPSLPFYIRLKPESGKYILAMGNYNSKTKAIENKKSLKKKFSRKFPSDMFSVQL